MKGFTLIELAIALFIVALMMGSALPMLSNYYERRGTSETERKIELAISSLKTYAATHDRLPCPTWPDSPTFGESDCSAHSEQGFLPWKTLGITKNDAWQEPLRYRVDSEFTSTITLETEPTDSLVVKSSNSNILSEHVPNPPPPRQPLEGPIVIVYSAGPNKEDDKLNASYDTEYTGGDYRSDFDDITQWMARPEMFSTLLISGNLPN